MDDLISRKAAIDAFEDTTFTKNEIRRRLSELPSAQPELKWIPCSERLPEKRRETYWVCTDAESQHECRWTNNVFGLGESDTWGWSIFDIPMYTKVLAWMSLPEPYKGEQE